MLYTHLTTSGWQQVRDLLSSAEGAIDRNCTTGSIDSQVPCYQYNWVLSTETAPWALLIESDILLSLELGAIDKQSPVLSITSVGRLGAIDKQLGVIDKQLDVIGKQSAVTRITCR